MPRSARLDAPLAVHHVIARGIDRTDIFRTDLDRNSFADRLGRVVTECGVRVLAWAFLSNHVHLLVQMGWYPISRVMQRLLTGHAIVFNRAYGRCGHLFQNRFQSILVDEEAYLQTLIGYVHLNPLRAGVVADVTALAGYPWSGHGGMLGLGARPWHATADALAAFGADPSTARRAYEGFVVAAARGTCEPPESGGWVDSHGTWMHIDPLRRGREAWVRGERVLGGGPFLEAARERLPAPSRATPPRAAIGPGRLTVEQAATRLGVTTTELRGVSRRAVVVAARTAIAVVLVKEHGLSLTEVARRLHTSRWSVRRTLARAQRAADAEARCLADLIAQLAEVRDG